MVTLTTVREINAAVWANVNCRNNGVFCQTSDNVTHRINRARTVKGVLQVHSVSYGGWVIPVVVYSM